MSQTPIAKRILYRVDQKNVKTAVEIFGPRPTSSGAFECEVRIDGAPEGLNRMVIGGSDSYQALLLATQALKAMVETYNKKHLNSQLRWEDDSNLDLGF